VPTTDTTSSKERRHLDLQDRCLYRDRVRNRGLWIKGPLGSKCNTTVVSLRSSASEICSGSLCRRLRVSLDKRFSDIIDSGNAHTPSRNSQTFKFTVLNEQRAFRRRQESSLTRRWLIWWFVLIRKRTLGTRHCYYAYPRKTAS
jgi:hypothetical protein